MTTIHTTFFSTKLSTTQHNLLQWHEKTIARAAAITWYKEVLATNEKALLQAVANQPVSVAIEGSGHSFKFYSCGTYSDDCDTNLDHAVTKIAYDIGSDGAKNWLVKHSWGENGYKRIQRDVAAREGLCGLAVEPSYPTT